MQISLWISLTTHSTVRETHFCCLFPWYCSLGHYLRLAIRDEVGMLSEWLIRTSPPGSDPVLLWQSVRLSAWLHRHRTNLPVGQQLTLNPTEDIYCFLGESRMLRLEDASHHSGCFPSYQQRADMQYFGQQTQQSKLPGCTLSVCLWKLHNWRHGTALTELNVHKEYNYELNEAHFSTDA